MSRAGVVTLLTDFGAGSVYVGQMHAVLLRCAPAVRVIDLAHDVPAGGIEAAAYLLQHSYAQFPAGSVHVAVVDPGVGSARRILAAQLEGHTFLAPDNGLLGPLLEAQPEAEVRSVESPQLRNAAVAPTFHGRDVFAPAAAHLAAGGALEAVGPPVEAEPARPGPVRDADGISGRVLLVDRFGNLITNVPRALLAAAGDPRELVVRCGAAVLHGLVETFSDVPPDALLAYVGSGDHLEIAVNGGRASDALGLGQDAAVRIEGEDA